LRQYFVARPILLPDLNPLCHAYGSLYIDSLHLAITDERVRLMAGLESKGFASIHQDGNIIMITTIAPGCPYFQM
jgi:hypothetical protein